MFDFGRLKNKSFALFFTAGVSLKTWHDIGMIDREVSIYNKLSKYFKHIYFFTYGDEEDLRFKPYLADNISIIPKKHVSNNILYSFMLPLIHRDILKHIDVVKTNQMWGSWSAVLAKLLYRNKLVVRTGYMLSINALRSNAKSEIKWILRIVESIAYKFADGVITSSQTNFEYVEKNYRPSGLHVVIPNYVETDIFKPMETPKKENSICFVGRLSQEKNLYALVEALEGLCPTSLDIIGSGPLLRGLKDFIEHNNINVNFLGNVPNHKLPEILNQHEVFILPSLYENMPKTLLEAMACGMPVIGTNVKGINEVIEHGKNGILCSTDPASIREAIMTLMKDEELRKKLGKNARRTIVRNYGLDKLVRKELELLERVI